MGSLFRVSSIVQPLLSSKPFPMNMGIENATEPNETLTNVVQKPTPSTPSMPLMSTQTDVSSMLMSMASLPSFSALRDYMKFFVLGGALEVLRRTYSASYSSLVERFFIRASFDSEDDVYHWMTFWLASLPQWRQFRDFIITTSQHRIEDGSRDLDEDAPYEQRRRRRPLRFLPSYTSSYRVWYKGRFVTVSRVKDDKFTWPPDRSTLIITIFTLDRSILDSLILEAREKWMSAKGEKIQIFANDSRDWKYINSRAKRPFNSIVLDSGIKELLLEDAREFMRSKEWYVDRGIPFRRGYLFYGAPGTGKTSIIHSLAGELDLDIYIVSLSKNDLDDSTLNTLMSSLPEHCIAVMEDIDAAFTRGVTRNTTGTELEDPRVRDPEHRDPPRDGEAARREGSPGQLPGDPSAGKESRITLSGLLNALDGISAQEGRLLFATTNRYHTLDPALTRPGRMDLHVEFRLASQYQAKELYRHFYAPDPPKKASVDGDEDDALIPGYTPQAKVDSGPTPTSSNGVVPTEAPKYNGIVLSTRAPELSKEEIEQLAEKFSKRIPERELSMASLQEYLMTYKVRPFEAVEEVEKWVKETREKQDRRAEAKAAGASA